MVWLTREAVAFEELELRSPVTNYVSLPLFVFIYVSLFGLVQEDLLNLLRHLPHLRRLTLEISTFDLAVEHYEEEEEEESDAEPLDWEWFQSKLRRVCPRLEGIRRYLASEVPGMGAYTRSG